MSPPRIGLFALTGFGNAVLDALSAVERAPEFVVTRRETGPFPYYPLCDLADAAAARGVPCFLGDEGHAHALATKPDVLLVATYHRILPEPLRSAAKYALNIHPALLPRYRGPNPFYWVLRNGEARTGVTVHALTGEVDAGEIYWQGEYAIAPDETQGSLRRRLAEQAGIAAVEVIERVSRNVLSGRAQRAQDATWFGRPTEADRTLDLTEPAEAVCRQARAAMPFPGACVARRSATAILEIKAAADQGEPGTILHEDERSCRVRVRDAVIVFALDGKASAPR